MKAANKIASPPNSTPKIIIKIPITPKIAGVCVIGFIPRNITKIDRIIQIRPPIKPKSYWRILILNNFKIDSPNAIIPVIIAIIRISLSVF